MARKGEFMATDIFGATVPPSTRLWRPLGLTNPLGGDEVTRRISITLFMDACVAAAVDRLIENADGEHKDTLLALRSRIAKRLV